VATFQNRHYAWNKRQFVGRLRIWTDWQNVLSLGHVPKGLGRKVTFEEFKKSRVKPQKNYWENMVLKDIMLMRNGEID
jgi:hypothetical protein